jgi:hypothetical protein
MSNWGLPTLTSTYTLFLSELSNRLNDAAQQNRTGGGTVPSTVTLTNPPVGTVRWNSSSSVWEANTGTGATSSVPVWEALSTSYGITVANANRWKTTRTISISSGDLTAAAVNIDGTADIAIASATLATVNSNVGAFGSASAVPSITVNAKGLITAVSTAALGSIATQEANAVAITGGAISGTHITLVQSTTAAPTAEGRLEWDTDHDLLMLGTGGATKTFAPLVPTAQVTMQSHTMSTGCVWGGNTVPVANGGTGAADAAAARTNLGVASMGTQGAGAVAITGGSIGGTGLTLVQSLTAAPTAEGVVEWDTNDDLLVVGTGEATKTFAPLVPTAGVTAQSWTMGAGCVWNGGVTTVAYGGTGAATLTGLVYGNAAAAFSAATAAQVVSVIGSTEIALATNVSAGAVGDLLYQSGANVTAKLADVATGKALLSGGVGVAPAYGKIGLTDHVSGTLALANGGTGGTDAATARSGIGAAKSGANTDITSLSSPALAAATATTAAVDTNTTQVATTAFVVAQASAVAGAALGTAAVGTSLRYARADHVHASAAAATLELATSVEVQTGTSSTKAIPPASLKSSQGFTNYFQSSQQTITSAGALTIAHGLGRKPILVLPFLNCTTADAGYSVNDELLMSGGDNGNNRSSSFVCDSVNINVRFSSTASSFVSANKADGVAQALVNASWKLTIRVWA